MTGARACDVVRLSAWLLCGVAIVVRAAALVAAQFPCGWSPCG